MSWINNGSFSSKQPVGLIEKQLMKKENWTLARSILCHWHESECRCDVCKRKITGRHMIDGLRSDAFEFASMCPRCHKSEGSGFGEGQGQLYSRTNDKWWILTHGFTSDQLMELEDEDDDNDF